MKFQTKIFLCNIILISMAFGICGYLLIQKDFKVSLEREINQALDQNQILNGMIETEVINLILKDKYAGPSSISNLEITKHYNGKKTEICIWGEDGTFLCGTPKYKSQSIRLMKKTEKGKKSYIIFEFKKTTKLLVLSAFKLDTQMLYVGNVVDVTQVFQSTNEQLNYYQIVILIVSAFSGVLTYMLSFFLTNSIARLYHTAKEMAAGNYSVRAQINSEDEIGELAGAFNRMAKSVEEHVEELVDYNQRQEEFVADFTHEVKTPLTAVVGYADLMQSGQMSEEMKQKAARYIYREGKRLNQMSQKLFELLLLNNQNINLQPVWMDTLLKDVAEIVKPQLEEKNIQLLETYEKLCINGDYELLKTIYVNLIDNARKASAENSVIEIGIKRRKGRIITEVVDGGTGIAPEDLHKIREAFYMVDKSRSRKEGGAGLGLSLVSKIVDLHQGSFDIESIIGEGTTMRITYREAVAYEKV